MLFVRSHLDDFLPFDGIKKRRLLHFPSTRMGNRLAVHDQDESFGFTDLVGLQKTIAEYLKLKYKFDPSLLVLHTETIPMTPSPAG